ncbi:MAG: hypothetical protein ACKOEC_04325 [Acidimicrobiia bacterium]
MQTFYPNFELPVAAPAATRASTRSSAFERVARALYGGYLMRRAASWESRNQVRLEAECLKLHTSSHRATTLQKFEAAVADATTRRTKPVEILAS